jgi:dienelactone hydrolase
MYIAGLNLVAVTSVRAQDSDDKNTVPPVQPEEVKEKPEEIAVALLDATANGRFEEATKSFDLVMSQLLPPAALKQSWVSITTQYGTYQGHDAPIIEQVQGSTLVRIPCRFEQGSLEAKISINSNNKIQGYFISVAGKYRSPNYVKPEAFETEEVEVGKGLLKLPGTLTIPKGEGRFPGVVLVQGSGPSDRDETVGPNKPFRDLAEGLASRGIAVVRYEKRTKHYPIVAALSLGSLTVHEETVHDAAEAVELLRSHAKIDPSHIYVVGHSLGGWMLPRIYEAGKPIAGLVSLAGSARPLEDLVLEQVQYLAVGDGEVSEEEKEQIEKIRQQVLQVKADDLSKTTLSSKLPLSIPPAYWLDLRGYNAPKLARDIPARWLMLQGDRDYQVIDKDLAAWEAGLKGHPDVTIKRYPKLNHLFMAGEGPCLPTEYFREANIDEAVIIDIAQWIQVTK